MLLRLVAGKILRYHFIVFYQRTKNNRLGHYRCFNVVFSKYKICLNYCECQNYLYIWINKIGKPVWKTNF